MTGDGGEPDVGFDDFRAGVAGALDAWFEWIEGRELRDDGPLCESCARSGLLESLAEFALLPHGPLHSLNRVVGEIVDTEVGQECAERLSSLRRDWHEALDPDEDGPPDRDSYDSLLGWYRWERDRIAEQAADLHLLLTREVRELIREAATNRELIGRALARSWIATSIDELDVDPFRLALVSPALRREVGGAVDAAIEGWMLWLPRGRWRRESEVPVGSRCELCTDSRMLQLAGPHGAVHALQRRLAELAESLSPKRGDGPTQERDPSIEHAEVAGVVAAHVAARLAQIHHALEVYVLPGLDDDIRLAVENVATTDEE